jgi:nicotinamidase-related amidase
MFEETALVLVDVAPGATVPRGLELLTGAFRASGRPVIHATRGAVASALLSATAPDLDTELLRTGGVQTLGTSEMAIGLRGAGAFDASPLDSLLRSLGVREVVIGGVTGSPVLTQTFRGAQVRSFQTVLATEELAIVLGTQLTPTGSAA